MKYFKQLTVALLVFLALPLMASSSHSFIIRHIRITGLQGISQATVRNSLPIRVGQRYNDQKSIEILQALYQTGFFDDVNLGRDGSTLVIRVVERATITRITFSGNKTLDIKKLQPVLASLRLQQGQTFDPSQLRQLIVSMYQQYIDIGHYSVSIEHEVKRLPRHRVEIHVQVHEGPIAKIKSIRFTGNQIFSERQLRQQITLSTSGIFSFFSHNDRYAKSKLSLDLEHLRDFYFNHGYLKFAVLDQQVQMSADKRHVNIVIRVSEGPVYHVSGFVLAGKLLGLKEQFMSFIKIKAGDVFARDQVMMTNHHISVYLADQGYAFPHVEAVPKIDDVKRQVFLTFQIDPGKHAYVRHINIHGNSNTNQVVIRREMRQFEGSLYSLPKINESKRRLANLPYLKNVQVSSSPVKDHPDMVDLDYSFQEVSAGMAQVQGGYSTGEGLLYGASISEPNFLGSGKHVSLGFQRSNYSGNYNLSYTNPYYTTDGVSRSISVYYTHVNPEKANIDAAYTMDGFGADVRYGIPVSNFQGVVLGYGYKRVNINNLDREHASDPVIDLIDKLGRHYDQFKLNAGWYYSRLDRAIFSTRGLSQSFGLELGIPVLNTSLGYYKLIYSAKYYKPLTKGFILNPTLSLGYGRGYGKVNALPFFYNFYAGGIETIPGFETNTLGPINPKTRNAMGGNVSAIANVNLILPTFLTDKIRTAITLNGGNVYQDGFDLGDFRYSAGIRMTWVSPFGPLGFSIAKPLNKKPGDHTQMFQFTMGFGL